MKFFKLFKRIHYIRRGMSSFKLFLWENCMFVNSKTTQNENKSLTIILSMEKSRTIHLCRDNNDTIKTFIDKLCLKISQKKMKLVSYKSSDVSLKINEIDVPNSSTCGEIFQENISNITLHLKDNVFKVMINLPIIKELKLGIPPYRGLMIYPYAISKEYDISIVNSKYSWYRIESKKQEFKVGNQVTYVPTKNDIDYRLKLVCVPFNEKGQFGPTVEVVSSVVEETNVDIYPYENRFKNKLNNSIRIVSYNILANEYTKTKEAKQEMYPYCSEKILATSYRHPLILNELQAYKADILCLQEVDQHFFNRELNPLLNSVGLDGIFFKKSGSRNEGLSCFYSSEQFVFLKTLHIKLNDLPTVEMYCGRIVINELWTEYLEKQTVLQVLVLKVISNQTKLLLICNTHLISNPEGDYLRLLQALVELIIINQIKQNIINEYPEHEVSVIFCGDFNSTPNSGVYELYTKLSLSEKYSEVKTLNDLKNIAYLQMCSAYSVDEVPYSNYTQNFVGLLDYIYFTNEYLELSQVLPMPLHEDVIKHSGIPSVLFPSDHIALIADFTMK